MSMQFKEENNPKHEKELSLHHDAPIIIDSVHMVKHKHDMGTISFICSILILSFLLINNTWLVLIVLNVDLVEKGIGVVNNASAVLIVVMMIRMYRIEEELTNDMVHVAQTCNHLNFE